MHILRISVITLFQHYFPADGKRLYGEDWGENWGEAGERVGEGLGRTVEEGWDDGIESYSLRVRRTKKREPRRFLFEAL